MPYTIRTRDAAAAGLSRKALHGEEFVRVWQVAPEEHAFGDVVADMAVRAEPGRRRAVVEGETWCVRQLRSQPGGDACAAAGSEVQ